MHSPDRSRALTICSSHCDNPRFPVWLAEKKKHSLIWSHLLFCFCGLSVSGGQSNLLKPLLLPSADGRLPVLKDLGAVFLCLSATSLGVCNPPFKLSFSGSYRTDRDLLYGAGATGTQWRAHGDISKGFSDQAEKPWHAGLGRQGWTAGGAFSLKLALLFRHCLAIVTSCYNTFNQFTSLPS